MLAVGAPAMGAQQLDFAAIGVDRAGHAALFVAEVMMTVRTFFIHRVSLVLHGLLDEQALQVQAGLADVLLDKAQALLGVLLDLLQALAEILPPVGEVLFQQAVLTVSHDFINQFFQRLGWGTILRAINSHKKEGISGFGLVEGLDEGESPGARAKHKRP